MQQKKFFLSLGLLLGIGCGQAYAKSTCQILDQFNSEKPYYMGLDLRYYYARPKQPWNSVFQSNMGGMGAFIGYDFKAPFSLEFGAQWSFNRRKSMNVFPNQAAFGLTNQATQTIGITGRSKLTQTYCDVRYRIQVFGSEIFPFLGVGILKPSVDVNTKPQEANNHSTLEILNQMNGASKPVIRAGFGIQRQVGETLGWRALIQFEQTEQAQLRNVAVSLQASRNYLYNGLSVGFGVFFVM